MQHRDKIILQKVISEIDIGFVKPDIINEISHIQSTKEVLAEEARNKASIVKENGVFVTCIGTIGKIGILHEECAFNQQKTARKNC